MNNTRSAEPTEEESAKMESELLFLFATMDRIDERIAKDQQEIDRLKAKTEIKLVQLRAF